MPPAPETRAKLLAAARQAFADLGYGKARVEDIVARAGVGHGTFYAYFPNKRAALAALIHDHAATIVDLASQPWGSGGLTERGGSPPVDKAGSGGHSHTPAEDQVRAILVRVLGGLADLYDADADLVALWSEASMRDPELGRVLDDVRRQFVERIARNIEHAAAHGLTREVDTHTAATALAAMAEQTLFLRSVRKEPLDRDTTVQTLADLWYHALYRPEPGKPGAARRQR